MKLAGGEEVTAWIYEIADPEQIADHPQAMVESSGDLLVYEWPTPKAGSSGS